MGRHGRMQQYVARGVHGQTVEVLAQRILNGQLAEGATLDIAALQSEFDVSLTVLREALRVLAAKGMVDARPKRGTFVRPRAHWSLLDGDVTALDHALDAMAAAGDDAGAAVAADLSFHRALLAATHNELVLRMEVL